MQTVKVLTTVLGTSLFQAQSISNSNYSMGSIVSLESLSSILEDEQVLFIDVDWRIVDRGQSKEANVSSWYCYLAPPSDNAYNFTEAIYGKKYERLKLRREVLTKQPLNGS
jgi:hypothetical protein